MKVSIITVVYNNEDSVEDAINSVLSQSYQDVEFIIVDGKSNDGTLEIIARYSRSIHKFISEKDKSNYDAYNKGLKLATGEIIGFLNSDDLFDNKDVISNVVKEFKLNGDLDIVYGNIQYVKKNNTNKIVRKWISSQWYDNFFNDGNVPPHPSVFIKKRVYDISGNFDIDFYLAADYEFMFRVFHVKKFKSKYLNMNFVNMRLGGRTNQSLSNIYKQNKDIYNVWKKYNLRPPFLFFVYRIFKRLKQFI
mgnify:CR=1 FL=1